MEDNNNTLQSQSDSTRTKQRSIKEIFLVGIGFAIIIGGISYVTQQTNYPATDTNQIYDTVEVSEQITLSIDGVYTYKHITISGETTALQVIEQLNESDQQLQLRTKSYGELGILIESMGDNTNGTGNKYWQYTVNDVAPMIGADTYVLKYGDRVVWEFKGSEF